MKTTLYIIGILFCFLTVSGQSQTTPYNNSSNSLTAFRNVNSYHFTDTIKNPKNVLSAEWFGGFKGALICSGAFTLSALLSVSSYGGALTDLGPGGFVVGILGMGLSALCLPFVISIGVNRTAEKYGYYGEYWQALVGPLLTGGAIFGIGLMGNSGLITYTAPITALIILPLASVISYNAIGHKMKGGPSLSLLNIQQGKIKIGTPVPAVYPNPFMQGKISSQISLLKISL